MGWKEPKVAVSQPRDKTKAGFLSLPGELRNRIYRLALVDRAPIVLKARDKGVDQFLWGDFHNKSLQIGAGVPAILATSRQVYWECARIFFEENIFYFQEETLSIGAIDAFRLAVGSSKQWIRRIGIRRSYRIGDMKPIQIHFQAELSDETHRIVIIRPKNENKPFPGIRSKLRGKLVEPCRCDVRRLAHSHHMGKYTSGEELLDFLAAYTKLVQTEAKTGPEIKVCKRCNCVHRG